jgi:hypothetical protein
MKYLAWSRNKKKSCWRWKTGRWLFRGLPTAGMKAWIKNGARKAH